ncbi:hypothetical protein KIH74_11370 [Kineosporia sp. J2-2]|uniref:histidine kinase n=1 Tax=Kineosporia corallincola TaxID=2835133 RepID=A0ABS5TIX0_9ACTN|nr:histidine kinase [Kineosporia corallincola]MBT0769524.1 hypothetical protein [Kineosporia corallincola]
MARAAHRAGWPRVLYEVVLTGCCALTSALLYAAYAPSQSLVTAALFALAGLLATLVVLPLRLLRPVTALVLGALLSLPTYGTGLPLIVLSAGAGYRARRPRAVVAGFAVVLVTSVLGAIGQAGGSMVFGGLLGVMLFCATAVFPAAVAATIAQRRLLVMTMHQRNLELHAERLLVAGQAQARERNRIAAELHDSLGHRLTLMSLYTGGLAQTLTGPGPSSSTVVAAPQTTQTMQTTEALSLLRDTSAQAMSELRQILRILHQDGPVEAAGRSLGEVEQTVAAARATGTEVELIHSGAPRPLSLLAEHAAFRVVQEGLTNALRHAGGAPVRIEIRYEEDALVVEVANRPGRPYQGASTGQGLHGLAERVRLAGGVLSQGFMDDEGFRLAALLPYDSEVPEPGDDSGQGDFPQQIRRSSRRQRIGLVAVVAAVLVCLAAGVGAFFAAGSPEPLQQNVFDSFRTGDDETRARELLPSAPLAVRTSPGGAYCQIFLADLYVQPESGGEVRYEVCFKDGVMESKQVLDPRAGDVE